MQQGRNQVCRTALLGLLVLLVAIGIGGAPQVARPVSAASTPPNGVMTGAYFDHAVVIIMEDHGMYQICGDSPPLCLSTMGAPYMAGLANNYAIGSQYLGVTHYSQADYLAMLGGTTDNCSSTGCPWPFNGTNLVDRLEAAGLNWKSNIENQAEASGRNLTYH